jgi:hypothetical protein
MNAIASRGTSGEREMGARVRRGSVWLALISLMVGFEVVAQQQTTAAWKEREIDFLYRSSTAIYTCSALRDRVASILLAVGARADVQVRVDNCEEFIGPQYDPMDTWQSPSDRYRFDRLGSDRFRNDRSRDGQSAIVRIHLRNPVEVTPEVLEELKKEKTRRELIARATGDPTAILQATGQFPAQWQSVTLSRKTIGLEPEECELLDQMSSVFRELGVRNVRRSFNCNPRQSTRIPPTLTAEALMSTPWGPSPALEKPVTEGDAQQSAPPASDDTPAEPATPGPK